MAERERGQAQIELIAGVPLVILALLVVGQLFGVLYAQSLADGAAQAGALAAADGRSGERAARSAMRGWDRDRVDVEVDDGQVRVEVQPATVVPWVGDRLRVSADAYARAAG